MKKFLLKVSFFVIYIICMSITFTISVDTFNVFHVDNVRDTNWINREYVKMKYILANPEKFEGYLFGSSRVGAIHVEKMPRWKIYNMSYDSGLPSQHLYDLRQFLAANIRAKIIYIGVDSISYTYTQDEYYNVLFDCPYEYLHNDLLHFCSLYIYDAAAFDTLGPLLTKNSSDFADKFYKYGGWWEYGAISKFNWNQKPLKIVIGSKYNLSGTLNDLREIVNLCRENNIELVIFTNPMHNVTYRASVNDKNYFEFLEGLAQITDFYNFSSLNNITLNNDNYLETSHYKAEVGDIIINVICNGAQYPELQAQGFGVKVTRDNVKDLITLLESQL